MTREEMLDKAMASDGEFDRVFIIGVLSTGIYCLPSCRARKPKPENIRFFHTIDEAREAGLRACKKCKPDDFFEGVDADLDRLEEAVAALRESPADYPAIVDVSDAAGMGSSKLFESVRKHYHTTPGELVARARVATACRLLLDTQTGVADIAFEVGFETLSTFYEHFGRLTGMAPTAYRKLPTTDSFTITLPECFQVPSLLRYFGRDPESLSERVEGNDLWVTANLDGVASEIHLTFDGAEVRCRVHGGSALAAHKGVVRILGLRQDPKSFEILASRLGHSNLVEGRAGLRVPLTFSPYDAVVWSILGQQVNLAFAYALRRRLIGLTGTMLSSGRVAPPTPAAVANLHVEALLPLQFSRRKAEYLIDSSRQIAEGKLLLDNLEQGAATRAERILLEVRGFGPWSVHYLMMRGLGFADCLPVGDTGLTSALLKMFSLEARPDPKATLSLMEPFSPHRSLACLHLWQSLKFES